MSSWTLFNVSFLTSFKCLRGHFWLCLRGHLLNVFMDTFFMRLYMYSFVTCDTDHVADKSLPFLRRRLVSIWQSGQSDQIEAYLVVNKLILSDKISVVELHWLFVPGDLEGIHWEICMWRFCYYLFHAFQFYGVGNWRLQPETMHLTNALSFQCCICVIFRSPAYKFYDMVPSHSPIRSPR